MNDAPQFRGKRLFVAIEPPQYVKDRLAELRKELKGFHWVPPDRMHLTLKFIGDVPGQFQKEIEAALDSFVVHPFILPMRGVGAFPTPERAHAVWAGIDNGHPRLFQLQKRIEDALFNIGIEPEKRLYLPHITLARVNHAAAETVRQFLKRNQDFESAPFRVDQFSLMRSEVSEGKRQYVVEKLWELPSEGHEKES